MPVRVRRRSESVACSPRAAAWRAPSGRSGPWSRARPPRAGRQRRARRPARGTRRTRLAIIDLARRRPADLQRGRLGLRSSTTARSTTTASCAASCERRGHRLPRRAPTPRSIVHLYEECGDDFVDRAATACSPSRSGTRARRRAAARARPLRHEAALLRAGTARARCFASEIKALLGGRRVTARARPRRAASSY